MADWVGASRSNSFKVVDETAFKRAMSNFEVTVQDKKEPDGSTRFVLFGNVDDGGWPTRKSLNETVEAIVLHAMELDGFDEAAGAMGDQAFALVDLSIKQLELTSVSSDDYTLAAFALSDEDPTNPEVDFFLEVGTHLADGEVAVFQEIGACRRNYVTGRSIAVRNDCEKLELNLNGIYDLVSERFGVSTSRAEI